MRVFIPWAVAAVTVLCPLLAAEEARPEGILIESEHFTRRKPDNKKFAEALFDPNASNGKVLFRFFPKEGRCFYNFTVPGGGAYIGWLRYSSQAKQWIGAAVDPADDAGMEKRPLPSTGGLEGPDAWRWAPIFEKTLAAGKHTLVLAGSPVRPDCILISTSKKRPGYMSGKRQRPLLDEATKTLLKKPVEKIRPDWLDGAAKYKLPEWFDSRRVCAHTRLSPRYIGKPEFLTAAASFRSLGFNVFVRHIKSGREGAWWPSKVGGVLPAARERSYAKEIIDNAHTEGCRIIVYHRHMEDEFMAEKHPDWVCVDWEGKPLKSSRGAYMCLNSPYADYFLTRALELTAMGADGFYFDEDHMPKAGCWCTFCRRSFKEKTGLDHPRVADPGDPIWRKLIDFNNTTIEHVLLKWRESLHARNPELVMLVGSNTYPGMTERHMTHRLFRIADSVKTEFSLAARLGPNRVFERNRSMKPPERDARIALGFTLARDSADGRPPHVWCHGLLNEHSALSATAGMITHGCIANLDHPEYEIPNPGKFKKAVELGNRASPHFAGTRPLRWAAVHYSEHARDLRYPDEPAMWKKVLYPTFGAYLTLLRSRLPVSVVTDSQIEEGRLNGYRILFLPAPGHLTNEMKRSVKTFETSGGTVVEQREDWLWHDPNGGQEKAMAAFLQSISGEVKKVPVRVFGGPKKMHAVAFAQADGKRIVVSLCNDFSWVWTGTIRPKKDAEKLAGLEKVPPPPPCRNVRILLRGLGSPDRVMQGLKGRELTFKESKGVIEIEVPEFQHMAVVVVEYE